jgi:hypothetical protein
MLANVAENWKMRRDSALWNAGRFHGMNLYHPASGGLPQRGRFGQGKAERPGYGATFAKTSFTPRELHPA